MFQNLGNTVFRAVNEEINDEDPKFKVGDIIRIPKHENVFGKDCSKLVD